MASPAGRASSSPLPRSQADGRPWQGTATDLAELSSMAAQLGAGSTHGLIAAGDDEIDVPP